jgi:hypothetical protein
MVAVGVPARAFIRLRRRREGSAVGVRAGSRRRARHREGSAVGGRPRAFLGGRLSPERRETGPERLEEAGRDGGQRRCGEGQGEDRAAHGTVSRGAGLGPLWSARAAMAHFRECLERIRPLASSDRAPGSAGRTTARSASAVPCALSVQESGGWTLATGLFSCVQAGCAHVWALWAQAWAHSASAKGRCPQPWAHRPRRGGRRPRREGATALSAGPPAQAPGHRAQAQGRRPLPAGPQRPGVGAAGPKRGSTSHPSGARVGSGGATFDKIWWDLPRGKHGNWQNPEIQVGHVKRMMRFFGVLDCAKKYLP